MLDVPTGCSTLQALIVFNQHLFVITAGVVHYYDQITIFPPPLLPPITAPNRFMSPIGCPARSGRTSFMTTTVILTSHMTSTFSYITLMGVQFCSQKETYCNRGKHSHNIGRRKSRSCGTNSGRNQIPPDDWSRIGYPTQPRNLPSRTRSQRMVHWSIDGTLQMPQNLCEENEE